MPEYKYPGVYIEELSSGVRPIEGVGTSTAAFIGFTGMSGPVDDEPVMVYGWNEYEKKFGKRSLANQMDLAVYTFFSNGGRKAYIIRLRNGAESAFKNLKRDNGETADEPILKISAKFDGQEGKSILVKVQKIDTYSFNLIVCKDNADNIVEKFNSINFNEKSDRYCINTLKASELITLDYYNGRNFKGLFSKGSIKSACQDENGILDKLNTKDLVITVNIDYSGNRIIKLPKTTNATYSDIDTFCNSLQSAIRMADSADGYKNVEITSDVANGDISFTLTSGSGEVSWSSVDIVKSKYINPEKETDLGCILKFVKDDGTPEQITRTQGTQNLIPAALPYENLDHGIDADPAIKKDSYNSALEKLITYPDINILLLPGITLPDTYSIIDSAIEHCRIMKNRMVIIDPPEEQNQQELLSSISIHSNYAALYYPWIKVMSPSATNTAEKCSIPPSSFAAAIWARTDALRGVWKAPAGMETELSGVQDLTEKVTNLQQEDLNSAGINVIRKINGSTVIWGARTLSSDAEWKYISVRRTAIYIEQSIFNGIQWAVFEPNNEQLWSSLRLNIESFLNGMFRAGAFAGKTARDAYYVRCGLNDTMTQGDIDSGQVIVLVGFAALKPAEFVIVRIQQKVGQN